MDTLESEFFREVTLRICGSLDIEQALEQVFEYIKPTIPVDSMGLGYSDVATGRIYAVAKVADDGAEYLWEDGAAEIALSGDSLAHVRDHSYADTPPLVVNRPEGYPEALAPIFPQLETSSAIFLSLSVRGEEVGALVISAKGLDRYTQRHADLIEMIREPFAIAMINARRYRELEQVKNLLAEDNHALADDMQRSLASEVVGADFGLREVMGLVRQIAPSGSPALLLGETGTGKEVIANAIHLASPRREKPMITMQCGAIPETLLDSELFGHEKGAFTGAATQKRGRFERADSGTLFLDEIGELSKEAQVKLLRVLQEQKFERVGGTKTISVDVRVIAATHRDLEQMVKEGSFREDLWYRLNVLPIRIPPLRFRREDIPSLVQYFIERKAVEMNMVRVPSMDATTMNKLKQYDWPGNVRELQNVVERALILSSGGQLHFPDFSRSRPPSEPAPVQDEEGRFSTLDQAMAQHIERALYRTKWKVSGSGGAAELLDINPSTLRFRMKKLGLKR